jgi:hypothetical protein
VRAFLDELGAVPFTEDEPLYRIGRRLLLAELALAEVRDDDLEGVALRSLAAVARQQCLSPTDREVVERVHRGAGVSGSRSSNRLAGNTMADDWTMTWSALIVRIGSDPTDDAVTWGADPIERSSVRRYLEPLEFDCALHYDPEAARRHGFTDVIAPYRRPLRDGQPGWLHMTRCTP